MKLQATSIERWNGGVRIKLQYGSRCMTKFVVHRPEDAENPSLWATVVTCGRTPGERATEAKRQAEPIIRKLLAERGIE